MTSHDMDEVVAVADRVAVLAMGKLTKIGTATALRHDISQQDVRLHLTAPANKLCDCCKAICSMLDKSGCAVSGVQSSEDCSVNIWCPGSAVVPFSDLVLPWIQSLGYAEWSFGCPTLDDVVDHSAGAISPLSVYLTTGEIAEKAAAPPHTNYQERRAKCSSSDVSTRFGGTFRSTCLKNALLHSRHKSRCACQVLTPVLCVGLLGMLKSQTGTQLQNAASSLTQQPFYPALPIVVQNLISAPFNSPVLGLYDPVETRGRRCLSWMMVSGVDTGRLSKSGDGSEGLFGRINQRPCLLHNYTCGFPSDDVSECTLAWNYSSCAGTLGYVTIEDERSCAEEQCRFAPRNYSHPRRLATCHDGKDDDWFSCSKSNPLCLPHADESNPYHMEWYNNGGDHQHSDDFPCCQKGELSAFDACQCIFGAHKQGSCQAVTAYNRTNAISPNTGCAVYQCFSKQGGVCPWLSGSTGVWNQLECIDGTLCMGWSCCNDRGGRARCPPNR